MADIIITEFMDDAAVQSLQSRWDVLYDPELHETPDTIFRELLRARALIVRNQTQVTAEMLQRAPQLVAVGRLGVGLDNIDLEVCKERKIVVIPATGANNQAVSEYVISTALILSRGAYHSTDAVLSGDWPRTQLIGAEISGKTLGLIGFGTVARQVARDANAMGMNTIAFDPFVKEGEPAWGNTVNASFNEVLRLSDVLSLHVPLSGGTRNMMGEEAIAIMKPGAILINTARGGIIDDIALVNALNSGKLGGAALDVFEKEPLPSRIGAKFKGVKNLILTPHIAGITKEANVRVSRLIAEKIAEALA